MKPGVPLLIHSDMGRGLIEAKRFGFVPGSGPLEAQVLEFLSEVFNVPQELMVFPAFNYDFANTGVFDVDNDPVQVGALPERLRRTGTWARTSVPFFSFLRTRSDPPVTQDEVFPFSRPSVFSDLVDRSASILMFGTTLESFTFIHHIEARVDGGPLYRYDKSFRGRVVRGGVSHDCLTSMHVRPIGVDIEYDWPKVTRHLYEKGALERVNSSDHLLLVSAEASLRVLLEQINKDPIFLLTPRSQAVVREVMGDKWRKLELDEFE